MELVRDYGDRDYLYSAKANELSETNPKEAINIYNQLNELNPDVQKYNKAIFKIREFEAEEIAKLIQLKLLRYMKSLIC